MKFQDKYTTAQKKQESPDKEKNKTELSADAFSIGDIIQELINKLEKMRVSK